MVISRYPRNGRSGIKYIKYTRVTKIDISIKGLSTISWPIQPRLNALQKKNQKINRWNSLK